MNDFPDASITVAVDPTNPGQFFACCGLLELADRLWPGAEGWFAAEGRGFKIACGGTLQELANGLGAWALIAALVGLVIGAAAWALGVHAQNFQQSLVGRRAVLVSGLAALLIGGAPPIVNFFFHAGTSLH